MRPHTHTQYTLIYKKKKKHQTTKRNRCEKEWVKLAQIFVPMTKDKNRQQQNNRKYGRKKAIILIMWIEFTESTWNTHREGIENCNLSMRQSITQLKQFNNDPKFKSSQECG